MAKFERQEVLRWEDGEIRHIKDDIVVESSLELAINGRKLTTLLCSPNNIKELAVGFLKSTAIIEDLNQIEEVNLGRTQERIELSINSSSRDLESYLTRKPALTSSGGRSTVVNDIAAKFKLGDPETRFSGIENLPGLMGEMEKQANLFQRTGGSHTAALTDEKELLYLAEDIGRHNAMDKAIGKAILDRKVLTDKLIFTSGRLSSEMVLKTIRSSIPILVSRSAPTTLAISLAKAANLTLVGFTRETRMTFYSGKERLLK